jgi:nickel/cobalt exporter
MEGPQSLSACDVAMKHIAHGLYEESKGDFDMDTELGILVLTALTIGFVHTALGPDHYIPFVAMARSNRWSFKKTIWITILCGIGHLAGSVLIGAAGLLMGSVLMQLRWLESFRGETAAWLLIGFGLAYLTWGILEAIRDVPHTHMHSHRDGTVHSHRHRHDLEHRHIHRESDLREDSDPNSSFCRWRAFSPWLLFLIFAFGPCEVLIPILMYPAAEANTLAVFAVVLAFSTATLATMVTCVTVLVYGLEIVKFPNLHRLSHAMAGFAILICGVLIKVGF